MSANERSEVGRDSRRSEERVTPAPVAEPSRSDFEAEATKRSRTTTSDLRVMFTSMSVPSWV